MAVTNEDLTRASRGLYRYLLDTHWNGYALAGPDPGIRFNARIGRFVKSYLHALPWRDALVYAQAQKYWIMSNWRMAEGNLIDARHAQSVAVACAEYLLAIQHAKGYWEYPNQEWKGRSDTKGVGG